LFLRNCWYVAAAVSEFDRDATVVRRLLGEPVMMYMTSDGVPVAFQDRCPHRLAPLSAGHRMGDMVQCGYHGLVFAPSGECVKIPGQDRVPRVARAKTYPIFSKYGYLWIWMGEPRLADRALAPDLSWREGGGWAIAAGYTHIAADYRLLSDNLLDLSHESYIHEKTIGNELEETIAAFKVVVTVAEGRVVRAHREMPDIAPPPIFKVLLKSDGRINRWQTAIWTAPAVNMTDVGIYPVGTPRRGAALGRVLHLLTPETETSSHYFWSQARNFRIDEADLTDVIRGALRSTFDEDKTMLELQQREIAATGWTVPRIGLKVDEAPVKARRILAGLIEAEAGDPQVVLAPGRDLDPGLPPEPR
jgi:phenylpropionate dioxygenase-like ring-hydroxylating dioxygenase large terminal subunit